MGTQTLGSVSQRHTKLLWTSDRHAVMTQSLFTHTHTHVLLVQPSSRRQGVGLASPKLPDLFSSPSDMQTLQTSSSKFLRVPVSAPILFRAWLFFLLL